MQKLAWLVFGAVVGTSVVSSCGGQPGPPAAAVPFADGTRLTAVYYQIDGTPPYFLRWYDSELGVDCSFQNGVCFPSQPSQRPFARDVSRFADSACTVPVVGTPYPGEARYFVWSAQAATGPGCLDGAPRLFHVADVVPSAAPLFLRDGSTGVCRPSTADEPVEYPELLLVGQEIPIDSLVTGTVGHDSGSARIVPITVVGSDGSFQGAVTGQHRVLAWDNERQETVAAQAPVPQDGRWYPASSYDARYFSDGACSARVALGSSCHTGVTLASAVSVDGWACELPPVFFTLGDRLESGQTIYRHPTEPAGCVPADWPMTDPTYATYAVGPAIPATSFAQAMEVPTGTGELRLIQVGSPNGPAMAAISFFDSDLGKSCGPSLAADGVVRCLPETIHPGQSPSFADESCTVPLVRRPQTGGACAPRPTFASLDDPADEPGGAARRHVYPIGEPYAGTVYGKTVGTSCYVAGTSSDIGDMFATGPEIPAASFAAVNLVHPDPSRALP